MIARRLAPVLARSAKSVLLLGPRQTGKSTLVAQLGPDLTINLVHEPTYLEDTLIVRRTDPFARSPRRRLVQHPKYYFFDVGVRNGLLGSFDVSPDRIGLLFEQLVFSQLAAAAAAADLDVRIASFRTEHGAEVDFVVEIGREVWALELQASRQVSPRDLRGLRSFGEYFGRKHTPLVLYLAEERRRVDGVDVVPWQDGLVAMGL